MESMPQAQAAIVQAQLAALSDSLPSPAASAQQAATRTAFDGLTDEQALLAARQQFASVMDRPAWSPAALPDGDRVHKWTSTSTAQLEDESGHPAGLLDAGEAVAAPEDGALHQADLSLERDHGDYVPANAPVDTTLPANIDDPVKIGSDVSVDVQGSGADAVAYKDKLFYANTGTDTDVLMAPVPTGFEVSWQLRSPASPQSLDLKVGGEATSLQTSADGRIANVLDENGRSVATVQPAHAWDADGKPVEASYTRSGDTLTVHVEHRGQPVSYPVMVDPVIDSQGGTSVPFTSWAYTSDSPRWIKVTSWGSYASLGVDLVGGSGTASVAASSYGMWSYRPPPPSSGSTRTAYVQSANFNNLQYFTTNSDYVCYSQGFNTPSTLTWSSTSKWFYSWPSNPGATGPYISCVANATPVNKTHCATSTCSGGTPGNQVSLSLWTYGAGVRSGVDFVVNGNADVVMDDPESPTISLPSSVPGQLGPNDTVTVTYADPGVGAKYIEVGSDQANWTENGQHPLRFDTLHTTDCTGTPAQACPTTGSLPLHIANLAPGNHTILARAYDATGKSSTLAGIQVHVDDVAPGVAVDTSDVDAGGTIGIALTDPGSGLDAVDITAPELDDWGGEDEESLCASGPCPKTKSIVVPVADLYVGLNTVHVHAVDSAGNATERDVAVTVPAASANALNQAPRSAELSASDADGSDPVASCVYDDGSCDAVQGDDGDDPTAIRASTAARAQHIFGISDQRLPGISKDSSSLSRQYFDGLRPSISVDGDTTGPGITSVRAIIPYDSALVGTKRSGVSTNRILSTDSARKSLDVWIDHVTGMPGHITPLITFGHVIGGGSLKPDLDWWGMMHDDSVSDADKRKYNPLPTPQEYETAIKYFLARYQASKTSRSHHSDPCTWYYTPWNEPNLSGEQPTMLWTDKPSYWPSDEPQTTSGDTPTISSGKFGAAAAAVYYQHLKHALSTWCSGTTGTHHNSPDHAFTGTTIAGDFMGSSRWSFTSDGWRNTYKRYVQPGVRNWAWHDYIGINGNDPAERFVHPDGSVTRKPVGEADTGDPWVAGGTAKDIDWMIKSIPSNARVWLTEQGPIFRRGAKTFPAGPAKNAQNEPTFSREAFFLNWANLLPRKALWDRVAAVYFYSWGADYNWDSGIFGYDNTNDQTAGNVRQSIYDAFKTLVMHGDD